MFFVFDVSATSSELERALEAVHPLDAAAQLFPLCSPPLLFAPDVPLDAAREIAATLQGVHSIYAEDAFPLVGRKRENDDVTVEIGGTAVGGKEITVIAGPCSVDTEDHTLGLARELKQAGAHLLRGGAFKPRTSPYAFEGHGVAGLKLLARARETSGLGVVTEALDAAGAEEVAKYADAIQIGARTMQAFSLLHAVGRQQKPVVLKRGFGCTVDETLHAAEHLLAHGANGVVFVERGIRTFEQGARFTLDLTGALRLKQLSRFPVLVDPSHATGDPELIAPLCRAAVAAGLDGVMVEVHNQREIALSDKDQALSGIEFAQLLTGLRPVALAVGRTLNPPLSTAVDVEHAA